MSTRWIVVLAWVASMLAVWGILGSQGFSLTVLLGLSALGSLALLASFWFGRRPTRSIWQVLRDVEGEPVLAPQAAAPAVLRADRGPRGEGPR